MWSIARRQAFKALWCPLVIKLHWIWLSSCVKQGMFVSWLIMLLLGGGLMSQQHASVSPGWICSDDCLCCHSDPICYLTQSQYTDTRLTSQSADPIIPGAWQGSHWSTNFEVSGLTPPPQNLQGKQELNPGQLFLRQTPYHLVDKEVQQQAKNISGIDLLRQLRKPNMTDAADQTFNLSISFIFSTLTLSQPVPALTI